MSGTFWLNGAPEPIPAEPVLLVDWLRERRQLTGTKAPCREGDCGACQVLVGAWQVAGRWRYDARLSCLARLQDLAGRSVLTIEALRGTAGALGPVQRAVADLGASQCGYCTPGLVVALLGWLLEGPELTPAEGERWLGGNLCRCTGYMGQRRAIAQLAARFGELLRGRADRLSMLIEHGALPALAAQPATPAPERQRPEVATPVVIGGGTDLYLRPASALPAGAPLSGRGLGPPLRAVGDGLWLNARHPLQALTEALAEAGRLPAFAAFCDVFAAPPVRRQATLGGNLAHASPVADSIPFLLALDAILHTSRRRLALSGLYRGSGATCLLPGEIIEWVELPAAALRAFVHFDKVSRRGTLDIAAVNAAGAWHIHAGRVARVALAVGGASPMPVRLAALEEALAGCPLGDDIEPLLREHLQPVIEPISDHRGSARYRRRLAQQLLLAQWVAVRAAHGVAP